MNHQPKSLKALRDHTVARILDERSGSLETHGIEKALQELLSNTLGRMKKPLPWVITRDDVAAAETAEAAIALRGKQLLRFCPMTDWASDRNFAPETVFEKMLANEVVASSVAGLQEHGDKGRWANQIPIWSGICGAGDRKTSIDIGYAPDSRTFSLYELKICSDHPLYAIVELITYAHGYLIVRRLAELLPALAERIRTHSFGLLDADAITFSVIAPADYYDKRARPRPRVVLSRNELEDIGATAARLLGKIAKKDFGFASLQIDLSILQLGCNMPAAFKKNSIARDRWLNSLPCSGSLRDVVLSATPISQQ